MATSNNTPIVIYTLEKAWRLQTTAKHVCQICGASYMLKSSKARHERSLKHKAALEASTGPNHITITSTINTINEGRGNSNSKRTVAEEETKHHQSEETHPSEQHKTKHDKIMTRLNNNPLMNHSISLSIRDLHRLHSHHSTKPHIELIEITSMKHTHGYL